MTIAPQNVRAEPPVVRPARDWGTIALALLVLAPIALVVVGASGFAWLVWGPDPGAPWAGEVPDVQAALAEGREPDARAIAQYASTPERRRDLRVVLAHYGRLDLLAPYDSDVARAEEEVVLWLAHEGIKVTRLHRGAVVTVRDDQVSSTVHAFAYTGVTGPVTGGLPIAPAGTWLTAIAGPAEDTPRWPAMSRTHASFTPWSRDAIARELQDFAALTDTRAAVIEHIEMLEPPPPL